MSQNPNANLFNRQTSSDPDELREFGPMADHGPKWAYLMGMLLYFGSSVAVGLYGLVLFLLGNPNINGFEAGSCFVVGLGSCVVLFFVTRRFIRLRAKMHELLTEMNNHGR